MRHSDTIRQTVKQLAAVGIKVTRAEVKDFWDASANKLDPDTAQKIIADFTAKLDPNAAFSEKKLTIHEHLELATKTVSVREIPCPMRPNAESCHCCTKETFAQLEARTGYTLVRLFGMTREQVENEIDEVPHGYYPDVRCPIDAQCQMQKQIEADYLAKQSRRKSER